MTETWDASCTHLVTAASVVSTAKVLQALVDLKPVVTIAYFQQLAALAAARKPVPDLPNVAKYVPLVAHGD